MFWFGPHVVIQVSNNITNHLAKLDEMRLVVPIARKRTLRSYKRGNRTLRTFVKNEEDDEEGLESEGSEG